MSQLSYSWGRGRVSIVSQSSSLAACCRQKSLEATALSACAPTTGQTDLHADPPVYKGNKNLTVTWFLK